MVGWSGCVCVCVWPPHSRIAGLWMCSVFGVRPQDCGAEPLARMDPVGVVTTCPFGRLFLA